KLRQAVASLLPRSTIPPVRTGERLIAATQLYIWSQVYHRDGRDLEAGMNAILDEVAAAGYPGVEGSLTACATAEGAERLRGMLDAHRLTLTSLYSGGCYYDDARARESLETLLP